MKCTHFRGFFFIFFTYIKEQSNYNHTKKNTIWLHTLFASPPRCEERPLKQADWVSQNEGIKHDSIVSMSTTGCYCFTVEAFTQLTCSLTGVFPLYFAPFHHSGRTPCTLRNALPTFDLKGSWNERIQCCMLKDLQSWLPLLHKKQDIHNYAAKLANP